MDILDTGQQKAYSAEKQAFIDKLKKSNEYLSLPNEREKLQYLLEQLYSNGFKNESSLTGFVKREKSATTLKFEEQQASLEQQRKDIAELEKKLQGFAPSEHDEAELEKLKNEMKENEIKVQNTVNELIEEKEKENDKIKKQLQTTIIVGVVSTVLTFVVFFIINSNKK